jgi:hypothetical protein
LAKQEKLASNNLINQLGKNRNFAKLTSPRVNIRALIPVAVGVAKSSGRVKKEIKNREGFLIQVLKRSKCINIILFLFQVYDVS